jgi:hypothetical protein
LGDDIVIGNKQVADIYLQIMKDLGVEINLSKSVVSTTNSLEFAKRLYFNGIDNSPYGPKSILQSINKPSQSLDLLISILKQEKLTSSADIKSLFNNPGNIPGLSNKKFRLLKSKY